MTLKTTFRTFIMIIYFQYLLHLTDIPLNYYIFVNMTICFVIVESATVAETILENMKTTIKNTITSAVMKEDLHSVMPPSHSTSPSSMPWQQLLVAPPQQVIVVDRMHSGARRHVTLDFGQPVLLTDIVIPACGDLVSICVEGWLLSEEIDEVLLVTASDIGTRHLLLNDLQPPPLVRYIRVCLIICIHL